MSNAKFLAIIKAAPFLDFGGKARDGHRCQSLPNCAFCRIAQFRSLAAAFVLDPLSALTTGIIEACVVVVQWNERAVLLLRVKAVERTAVHQVRVSVAATTHRTKGPLAAKGGFELPLTNLAAAAALAAAGPGRCPPRARAAPPGSPRSPRWAARWRPPDWSPGCSPPNQPSRPKGPNPRPRPVRRRPPRDRCQGDGQGLPRGLPRCWRGLGRCWRRQAAIPCIWPDARGKVSSDSWRLGGGRGWLMAAVWLR